MRVTAQKLIDLRVYRTSRFTAKFWIDPQNEIIPLKTLHFEYFRDPKVALAHGVTLSNEVCTRLSALRVGFVRGNYQVNGGLLTLETMRRDRLLRKLIDAVVLANADALDMVRLNTVDTHGQATNLAVAPLHQMRQFGKPINRATLGSWSYSREIKAPGPIRPVSY